MLAFLTTGHLMDCGVSKEAWQLLGRSCCCCLPPQKEPSRVLPSIAAAQTGRGCLAGRPPETRRFGVWRPREAQRLCRATDAQGRCRRGESRCCLRRSCKARGWGLSTRRSWRGAPLVSRRTGGAAAGPDLPMSPWERRGRSAKIVSHRSTGELSRAAAAAECGHYLVPPCWRL